MSDRRVLLPGEQGSALIDIRPLSRWYAHLGPYRDDLAEPAPLLLEPHVGRLLPQGGAWRRLDGAAFDGKGLMGGLVRALARALEDLYRRVFIPAPESTASTLVDSLEDWERDWGFPDPCIGGDLTRAERIKYLLAKIRSLGVITPRDYIDLAAAYGYRVTIEEPQPFECGVSDCGGSTGLAGGQDFGGTVECWIIVRVHDTEIRAFETGVSETGVHPLTDFDLATSLECLFRRLAPAWAEIHFAYSET